MDKKIKILHLEDSANDAELIHSLIEYGKIEHDYFLAETENTFLNFLETENINIILSDYSLPEYNGNEALKAAREKYPHIPFIFVSGMMGEDAAINAMLNGATDYVLKNKLERLMPAIKRALHEHELEVKREQSEINLKEKNQLIKAQNEELVQINKELENSKEKAEESNRLKSIFLTNLSHELRTPLNSILGFSQLITSIDDKSQIIDFAKIINKDGNQLLAIIEDLFIVSSILSENITIAIKEIPLDNLLDKARFIINDEILKSDKKNLTYSIFNKITKEKSVVLADSDMFGEIIRKLIRNAIMFSTSGQIEVGYQLENNYEIEFYVRDKGIGIPFEKQEVIFDFFRQVEESSNKKFGGIGSGLAISKNFVESMNGSIWVNSETGKGSTFHFKLPLAVNQPNTQITQTNNKIESKNELSNKTVLIVDDTDSNRLYLEYILNDLGIKTISAENGTVAVEFVKRVNSIDLILMDLNMPYMDGYEATKLIKKMRPDIPIIAQTAYSLPEHRDKALNSGCNAFIKKPINVIELEMKMNECFNIIEEVIYE